MARTIVALLNGLLYDPTQDPTQRGLGEPLDVHIRDGRVAAICPAGSPGPPGEGETVDLGGRMWILPGLVDMHVHLRVPGEEHKETLETGLRAAVVGGFSSVLAMPNVSPAIDDAARVRSALCQAQSVPGARLLQSAAMTLGRAGEELCEYAEIRAAGAVAVTDDGAWVSDGAVMRRVLEYAAVHDLLPLSHSEDMTLSKGGQIHEGRVSTRLGLKGIPPQAEEVAIYRDIALARLTGQRLHLCHVSTGAGIDLVRRAKAEGVRVSCETAPHYLFLTDESVMGYNANAKMKPPLRTPKDIKALREGILDGTIDAIATDHAPHSLLEKDIEFPDASFGIIGLETALGLCLELARDLSLPPERLAALLSVNPAGLLGQPQGLAVGQPADATVVDPSLKWVYRAREGYSLSSNTPFEGREFTGRAALTVVGGEIRADNRAPA